MANPIAGTAPCEFTALGEPEVTREFLKDDVDKIQDRYLERLYQMMKVWINLSALTITSQNAQTSDWHAFIEQTYGSLADDPIEL